MNERNATPATALPALWVRDAGLPYQSVELPDPQTATVRRLSPVERATVRVTVLPIVDIPRGRGVLFDAARRLALFRTRGVLPYASGHWVAQQLQAAFWPAQHNAGRHARRGWVLLAELDKSEVGVQVYVSAEPLPGNLFTSFRRMRLYERIAEIEDSERD